MLFLARSSGTGSEKAHVRTAREKNVSGKALKHGNNIPCP